MGSTRRSAPGELTVRQYTVIELGYINIQKNSDKLYRGYLDHSAATTWTEYGKRASFRPSRAARFNEVKQHDSVEAAHSHLMEWMAKKTRKGYQVHREVLKFTCDREYDQVDLSRAATVVPNIINAATIVGSHVKISEGDTSTSMLGASPRVFSAASKMGFDLSTGALR